MTSAFRTTALAAALAAFSCGALAVPVVLDFEALGKQAVEANAPISVGAVDGFYFQGAYAYNTSMLSGNDPMPAGDNAGGYLVNRGRDFKTNDIVISLQKPQEVAAKNADTATDFSGQFFQAISFSLFSSGASPTLSYTTASGRQEIIELNSGSGAMFWSFGNGPFDFDPQDQVTSLVFSARGAVLGLDNMEITLTAAGNPGGGGNVPEPTSYALVGLALLAAGAATRRRA